MWARSWRVWIPGRQVGLNDLLYDRGKRVGKSKSAGAMALLFRAAGVPRLARIALSVECVEPNMKRDPDNAVGGAVKVALDALQHAGVINNDGWKHIASLGPHTWRCDPAAPGVMVTITES
jgi:Holliday junction resolvase RusA-like endonuclease